MNKHYEQKVNAKYLGGRRYEVTASEILVTEKKGAKHTREKVREIKQLLVVPTIWTSFLTGESLAELYKRRIVEIDETFKLYDFDKISIHNIVEALAQAAKKVGQFLPQPYIF